MTNLLGLPLFLSTVSAMTAAMLLGLTREAAARFSFLLGIPAIGAAGVFELRDLLKHGLSEAGLSVLVVGTLAAVAADPGQLVGSGTATVSWLGTDSAERLLIGLVQVAFVLAAVGVVTIVLRYRRFRLLTGLLAGALAAAGALSGILYLAGDKHPHQAQKPVAMTLTNI